VTVPTIAVVGTGAVARAVVHAQRAVGGRVVAVISRDADRAARLAGAQGTLATTELGSLDAADAVIVAVSDRAIPEVGARLSAQRPVPATVFLHTSGLLSGAELAGAPVRAGSLHPLQSFPRVPESDADGDALLGARVRGAHWFHEGEGDDVACALVEAWGGTFHALAPGSKAIYHAGAAILSNHTVALFAAATRLFASAGVDADAARAPLSTLLAGTAANLAALGTPAALTGPIARGDVETVRAHLDAMRTAAPDLIPSYVEAARLAVDVALAKGTLSRSDRDHLLAALDG
jgi:predicted short-subunit dehydrogenase-like oxidoreductase (DUF2520 family)